MNIINARHRAMLCDVVIYAASFRHIHVRHCALFYKHFAFFVSRLLLCAKTRRSRLGSPVLQYREHE